jgi:hypothetical protein
MATNKNERLKELLKATEEWAATRTKELQDQATIAKRIMANRPGQDQMANDTVSASVALTSDEISAFTRIEL